MKRDKDFEAVMEAAPVGLCYTRGASGDRVVGNRALRSQFEYIARHGNFGLVE